MVLHYQQLFEEVEENVWEKGLAEGRREGIEYLLRVLLERGMTEREIVEKTDVDLGHVLRLKQSLNG